MIKKILFLFIIFYSTILAAQDKKTLITGSVSDSLGIVKNVNIINIKTKQGTFSNDEGLYRIYVSKGDTLSFSSVQHKLKKFVITEDVLKIKEINIVLSSSTYNLDEFTLKKNNLKGILSIDVKETPKSKRDSLLKNTMDFSNVNFNQVDTRIDNNTRAMPPITNTDPNKSFEGLNILALFAKKPKPYKPIVKDEFDKNKVPKKILNELGEDYFFKKLKIPKQNYQHFLEFCDLPKILSLYKKGKVLDMIQIFQDQSVFYLKSIKK